MKRINFDILQKGDIVLTTSDEKMSGLIRYVTESDISHAMICITTGTVMDSTSEGVQARNIQKLSYDDSCKIYILRLRSPLSKEKVDRIIKYVRSSTGVSYTKVGAVSSLSPKLDKKGGVKQFCSRMVARAYASVGINLTKNPNYCTPEDIKKSELLTKVANAWVYLTEEELEIIKTIGDTTFGMREVTNSLLQMVREINPKIESLNDIDQLLIQRPDLDDKIVEALRSSEYLDYWKVEISRFPWRYNPIEIIQFYHSSPDPKIILEYCHRTLLDHKNGVFAHWEVNAKEYQKLYSSFQLESFRLLADLYQNLNIHSHLKAKCAMLLHNVFGDKNAHL